MPDNTFPTTGAKVEEFLITLFLTVIHDSDFADTATIGLPITAVIATTSAVDGVLGRRPAPPIPRLPFSGKTYRC